VLGLVLTLLAGLPGCGGCLKRDPLAQKQKQEEEEKKKKKKPEKPKEDFEPPKLWTQPRDATLTRNLVKPGHWTAAVGEWKANNFDFAAEVETAAVNIGGEPVDIPNTAFRMTGSRPASLPKGQAKQLELLYFVPDLATASEGKSRAVWLNARLVARRGGHAVREGREPTTALPPYRYFLIVLAATPEGYGYLKKLDSVEPPLAADQAEIRDRTRHYEIISPRIEGRVPLSPHPLTWTSIAYVLWDGVNPKVLTPDQQQTMLDWLHWGGQLIISGPGSLDLLKGSFLSEHLPAEGGAAVPLQASDLAELNGHWSLPLERREPAKALPGKGAPVRRAVFAPRLQVTPTAPLLGVRLEPHSAASALPATGGLVVERRVGRGRIVVTAFPLTDRRVVNWASYDSFFNACLLRRPRRAFQLDGALRYANVSWKDHQQPQTDGRFVTNVRYFSRDTGTTDAASPLPVAESAQASVAAWNDKSGVSVAARDTLREAAGISIPRAWFVFQVLAAYLIVLAPANWAVFRLLGRVEWAWVAAPVIAIAGTVAVVRLAQLDIGFVRSRSEVGVLELHGGYARGHLTRYTALYSSLSAHYDLEFADPSALSLPFPAKESYQRALHDTLSTVGFRRDKAIHLTGFPVVSNSTGLLHSEQMYDVGGTIGVLGDAQQGWIVRNATPLDVQDAVVLWRSGGELRLARIGTLAADGSVPLRFAAVDEDAGTGTTPEGALPLRRLFESATRRASLADGDMRLVGWTAQQPAGMTIRPHASKDQDTVRTLVLVHLLRGPLRAAQPDENLRASLNEHRPEDDEEGPASEKPEPDKPVPPPTAAP
jgi:hypothetical protein